MTDRKQKQQNAECIALPVWWIKIAWLSYSFSDQLAFNSGPITQMLSLLECSSFWCEVALKRHCSHHTCDHTSASFVAAGFSRCKSHCVIGGVSNDSWRRRRLRPLGFFFISSMPIRRGFVAYCRTRKSRDCVGVQCMWNSRDVFSAIFRCLDDFSQRAEMWWTTRHFASCCICSLQYWLKCSVL